MSANKGSPEGCEGPRVRGSERDGADFESGGRAPFLAWTLGPSDPWTLPVGPSDPWTLPVGPLDPRTLPWRHHNVRDNKTAPTSTAVNPNVTGLRSIRSM